MRNTARFNASAVTVRGGGERRSRGALSDRTDDKWCGGARVVTTQTSLQELRRREHFAAPLSSQSVRAAASFGVVSPGLSAALCVCIARDGLEPLPPRLTKATTGPSRREQSGRVA